MEINGGNNGSVPRAKTHHNFDAHIQSGQLSRWEQQYDQLSPGPFTGTIRELQADQLHLFCENSSAKLRQQCQVNKKSYWFGFSSGSQTYHINEKQVSPYQLLAMRDHTPFELVTPGDFSIYSAVLEIDDNNPDSYFLKQSLEHIENNNQPQINPLTPSNIRLLYNLRMYIDLLIQRDNQLPSSNTIKNLVTDTIMNCLTEERNSSESLVKPSRRIKVIKDLKALVNEPDFSSPITIAELCSKLFISRRALQYACEEKLGCNPHQFLLATRLNRVKRMISDPENDLSIADIALSMGFFHYGLFCSHYRKLFGEYPRRTAQRNGKSNKQII